MTEHNAFLNDIERIAANAANQEHTTMTTTANISDIELVDTTANFRFRPRSAQHSITITGSRELTFEQDSDGSWMVLVRDAGHPADGEAAILATMRSITVTDPAGIAVLNRIMEVLASPAAYPTDQHIAGAGEDVSTEAAD